MFARYPGFLQPHGGGGGIPWNPADLSPSGAGVLTFSAGDLIATKAAGATAATVRALFAGVSSGKWYFEIEVLVAAANPFGINAGICDIGTTLLDNWSSQPASSMVVDNGSGVLVGSGFTPFGSGAPLGGATVLGVLFEPGVNINVNIGGATPVGAQALGAGNFVPCINLGRDYFGTLQDADGCSLRLRTGSDILFTPPAGFSPLT